MPDGMAPQREAILQTEALVNQILNVKKKPESSPTKPPLDPATKRQMVDDALDFALDAAVTTRPQDPVMFIAQKLREWDVEQDAIVAGISKGAVRRSFARHARAAAQAEANRSQKADTPQRPFTAPAMRM